MIPDPTAQSNTIWGQVSKPQSENCRRAQRHGEVEGREHLDDLGSALLQLYINSYISTTDLTWRRKADSSFGAKPSSPDLLLARDCNEVWGVCQYINKELSPICHGIPEEPLITQALERNGMWVELGTKAAS